MATKCLLTTILIQKAILRNREFLELCNILKICCSRFSDDVLTATSAPTLPIHRRDLFSYHTFIETRFQKFLSLSQKSKITSTHQVYNVTYTPYFDVYTSTYSLELLLRDAKNLTEALDELNAHILSIYQQVLFVHRNEAKKSSSCEIL